jgi:hypothetical protein
VADKLAYCAAVMALFSELPFDEMSQRHLKTRHGRRENETKNLTFYQYFFFHFLLDNFVENVTSVGYFPSTYTLTSKLRL